jgi:hypothetical protein
MLVQIAEFGSIALQLYCQSDLKNSKINVVIWSFINRSSNIHKY